MGLEDISGEVTEIDLGPVPTRRNVNFSEGSIPFTRSIVFQGFSHLCSKSAVNSSRLDSAVKTLARRRVGFVKLDEAGGRRCVRGDIGPRPGHAGSALQAVGNIRCAGVVEEQTAAAVVLDGEMNVPIQNQAAVDERTVEVGRAAVEKENLTVVHECAEGFQNRAVHHHRPIIGNSGIEHEIRAIRMDGAPGINDNTAIDRVATGEE